MSSKKSNKVKPKKNNGMLSFIKNNNFNNQMKSSANTKTGHNKH